MTVYVLTMRNGIKERWEVASFMSYLNGKKQRIGHNFQTRLTQLREYTGQDVTDWKMHDGPDTGP